jgi:cobalt-zinc-cadmium resistance protein CzcA
LNYYENYALRQARLIRERSEEQMRAGAVGYIEWMMLVNQSIQIESDYF